MKQSRRRRPSHWIASLGNVPLAMTGELSLRAAKRQSNPVGEGPHAGLLRSAMCRSLAMTRRVVIASRKAAKQSRRRRPSRWIASLGNVPLARNDAACS
ncbi:MAG: hypothetical protein LBT00_08885 [Spirochaetaceae bacterium]|nr:hypothetical protein [Spirochaetaceae bacterium]